MMYNGQHFIVAVDYFSGYIEVKQLRSTASKDTIQFLKENIARYGIPD